MEHWIAASMKYVLEKQELVHKSFLVTGISSNLNGSSDCMIQFETDINKPNTIRWPIFIVIVLHCLGQCFILEVQPAGHMMLEVWGLFWKLIYELTGYLQHCSSIDFSLIVLEMFYSTLFNTRGDHWTNFRPADQCKNFRGWFRKRWYLWKAYIIFFLFCSLLMS